MITKTRLRLIAEVQADLAWIVKQLENDSVHETDIECLESTLVNLRKYLELRRGEPDQK